MLSGRSGENAWGRRSWGVGARRAGSALGGGSSARGGAGGGGGGGADGAASGGRPSVSVLGKRAASGPSRILARLPLAMFEHLLRQLAIGVGRRAAGVVSQHRHAFDGRLREAHGLLDAGSEDAVPEVLLEDLERFLGVERPGVDHRG